MLRGGSERGGVPHIIISLVAIGGDISRAGGGDFSKIK
jgi:hypothetical protein